MNKKTLRRLRVAIPVALVVVAGVAYVANAPVGDLSAFGWGNLMLLCPLGALAAMIASRSVIPAAILSLICFILLIVLVGKAFCAWACPVPVVSKLRGVFSGKKGAKKTETAARDSEGSGMKAAAESADAEGANAGGDAAEATGAVKAATALTDAEKASLRKTCGESDCTTTDTCESCASKRGAVIDSRHFILGGALGTTLLFGFPVFCLVCPIGLTFASVFLVANLFTQGDVTWTVIAVPALLIVEVVLFRKWCHRLCPISALMSLTAKANRTFVPVIDDKKCLETSKGVTCGRCGAVCGEGIDLRHPELSAAAINECTKCHACADACPGSAITFPVGPLVSLRDEKKAVPVMAKGASVEKKAPSLDANVGSAATPPVLEDDDEFSVTA